MSPRAAKRPTKRETADGGTLGVDLGIVNLATDSEGEHFTGHSRYRTVRARYHLRRQRLQKVGTKNAKRRLRKNAPP